MYRIKILRGIPVINMACFIFDTELLWTMDNYSINNV